MEQVKKPRKTTRRRNGDGTTYRHKNGWRTKITRGSQSVTAMGRSEQESRRNAKEKLAKLPLLDDSLVVDSENLLFGEFMVAWLTKKHVKNITDTTYRRYESLTRHHVLPALGHMKLRSITKNHINAFIEKMDESGQSARSCQQTRALLSAAFKRAVLITSPAMRELQYRRHSLYLPSRLRHQSVRSLAQGHCTSILQNQSA